MGHTKREVAGELAGELKKQHGNLQLMGKFWRELSSCWVGVAMNGIVILLVLLLSIFPPTPPSYFLPVWSLFAALLVLALSVAGMGLAMRDFFRGERFVACLVFGLCGWPWTLVLLVTFFWMP